ncbi:MAG: hypothetical protein WC756_18475 [Taibaiella sp.]|jgi:hypothetical protein
MENKDQKGEHQVHKNQVDKNTEHIPEEEIERMPSSDDDYRLPRSLPEERRDDDEDAENVAEEDEINDDLIDEDTDISATEIALLEEAERDTSSDESRASDLLDDADDDGDALNEGPDEDNAFDTGEDLDMTNDVNNPDIDEEDEDF